MGQNQISEYMEEHPIYSTNVLLSSIADLIAEKTGVKEIYTSSITSGDVLPRFFIFIKGDLESENEPNETGYKYLPIEIIYEQDYNIPNLFDDYIEKADILSEALRSLTYNIRSEQEPHDIIKSIPLDVHSIKTRYDQESMHCDFDLRLRLISKEYLETNVIKKINWKVENKNEQS